jgi:NitT/TauT family transport system substrate-binding protein
VFFFEKKNQKTFIRWWSGITNKSLFASFSSEKEESSRSCLPFWLTLFCLLAGGARADGLPVGSVGGPNPQLWPAYIANAQGFFGKLGTLDFAFSPSSAATIQLVVAGSLPVAASAGLADPIRAAAQGGNVVILRIDGQSAPYELVGKPGIKTLADLKGKTIIIGGAKDITHNYLEAMLAPSGLKPGDYDLVFAGATSQRYAALTSGAVDAAILYPPFMFRGVAAGYTMLGKVVDFAPDLPFSGIAANKDWAMAHSDAVTDILAGYTRGIAWLSDPAHRGAAIELMLGLTHSDRTDLENTLAFLEQIHYFDPTDEISRRKLGAMVALLQAQGDVPAGFDLQKLVLPGVVLAP